MPLPRSLVVPVLLIAAFIVSGSAATSHAQQSIPAIGHAEPEVGQAVESGMLVTFELDMAIDLAHGAASMEARMVGDSAEVFVATPLAVRNGVVERMRLECTRYSDRSGMEGALETTTSPTQGRSYDLRLTGRKPRVRYTEGGKPPQVEVDEVLEQRTFFDDLGGFAADFPSELLVVGAEVELTGDAIASVFPSDHAMLGGEDDGEIGAVRLRLVEIRETPLQTLAVIEMSFDFSMTDMGDGMSGAGTLAGTVELDVTTGWVERAHFSGPLSLHMEGDNDGMYMIMDGQGAMTLEVWERRAGATAAPF